MSADLGKMAEAFNTTVDQLEVELKKLILSRQMSARIDSHARVGTGDNHTRCSKLQDFGNIPSLHISIFCFSYLITSYDISVPVSHRYQFAI